MLFHQIPDSLPSTGNSLEPSMNAETVPDPPDLYPTSILISLSISGSGSQNEKDRCILRMRKPAIYT